jgi:hypothetical protein
MRFFVYFYVEVPQGLCDDSDEAAPARAAV